MLRRLAEQARSTYGPVAVPTAMYRSALGRTYQLMGRPADAEPELLAAQHVFDQAPGLEYESKRMIRRLVTLYEEQGNDAQATAWQSKLPAE